MYSEIMMGFFPQHTPVGESTPIFTKMERLCRNYHSPLIPFFLQMTYVNSCIFVNYRRQIWEWLILCILKTTI